MFRWKKALTPEQAELLARFREFERGASANYDDYRDDGAGVAFEACRQLVVACCRDPKDIDWSKIKPALKRALDALDLEHDFPLQVFTALAVEHTDEQEALKRFPRIAWQQEVASGKTDLGYDVWFEQTTGVKRRAQ
jgi:hypothetical protein